MDVNCHLRRLTAALYEVKYHASVVIEIYYSRLRIEHATLIKQSPTISIAISPTRLLYVSGVIETISQWILAKSKSARNMISKDAFNDVAFCPPLSQAGEVRVINCSNEYLDINCFANASVPLEGRCIA